MPATPIAPVRRSRLSDVLLAASLLALAAFGWRLVAPSQAGSGEHAHEHAHEHVVPAADTPRNAVGPATRFDQVAVFDAGTPSAAIEVWRAQVLAQPHVAACLRGHACVQRVLRLSGIGPARAEVIAFDLDASISDAERAALLEAAATATPQARLHARTSPLQAAGDNLSLPSQPEFIR